MFQQLYLLLCNPARIFSLEKLSWNVSFEFELGNGTLGMSFPKNAQSGPQPSFELKISKSSVNTVLLIIEK